MNAFVRSAAAGIVGGACGLLAMKYAMQGSQKLIDRMKPDDDEQADTSGAELQADGSDYISISGFHADEGESATGALARVVYERVRGRTLDDERRERLGNWVHRGYGGVMATAYSLFAFGRGFGVRGGTLYGAALWAVGDELMVPLLGLAKKPTAYPPAVHLSALAGHLAFGAALGGVVTAAERWGPSALERAS